MKSVCSCTPKIALEPCCGRSCGMQCRGRIHMPQLIRGQHVLGKTVIRLRVAGLMLGAGFSGAVGGLPAYKQDWHMSRPVFEPWKIRSLACVSDFRSD